MAAMHSLRALGYTTLLAIGFATLTGCAGEPAQTDDPSSDESGNPGDSTIPASAATRTDLGIDRWQIARHDESTAVRSAVMEGYSADGQVRRAIKVTLRNDTREGIVEVAIDGQPAAVAQTATQADGSVTVERYDFDTNVDAQKTITYFSADFGAVPSSPKIETKSLRIQVGDPGNLIKDGPFITCMEKLHPFIGSSGGKITHADIVRICTPLSG